MCPNGAYGIIHIHKNGADIVGAGLSFTQVNNIIKEAMKIYPECKTNNSFEIKEKINNILKELNQ